MTYPEVSSAFWRDLLIGYLLTAVASFATVKNMFQKQHGKLQDRKILKTDMGLQIRNKSAAGIYLRLFKILLADFYNKLTSK